MSGFINVLLAASAAKYSGTMVAGTNSGNIGYQNGLFGSLSGSGSIITVNGGTMSKLYDTTGSQTILAISFAANPGQTVFKNMIITGNGINVNVNTSSLFSYGFTSGLATWTWSVAAGLVNTDTYLVTLS